MINSILMLTIQILLNIIITLSFIYSTRYGLALAYFGYTVGAAGILLSVLWK